MSYCQRMVELVENIKTYTEGVRETVSCQLVWTYSEGIQFLSQFSFFAHQYIKDSLPRSNTQGLLWKAKLYINR